MKNILIIFISLIIVSCSSVEEKSNFNLYKLYSEKQFAEMEFENSNQNDPLFYFYKAVYTSVCNKPQRSNYYLDSLISKNNFNKPDSVMFNFWKLRNDNYVKLFDYNNAFKTSDILIKKYPSYFKDDELADEKNTRKIWEVLKLQSPQKIQDFSEVTIPMTYDIAKLANISVKSSDKVFDFVFDTGAGISAVMESIAKELGFIFMENKAIKVKGFTGVDNDVKIAIAKEININGIIITNAPFLVFKDEALTFGNGTYKINGIIGFPIAKELGTITITSNTLVASKENISIPKTDKNLFFEMLHPIVYIKYKNSNLPCIFDTGADHSLFSKKFYNKFENELKNTGSIKTNKIESAGGKMEHKTLLLGNVKMKLGSQEIKFQKMEVDIENFNIKGPEFYGNIGQDIIQQYKSVTISFDNNYLKLNK